MLDANNTRHSLDPYGMRASGALALASRLAEYDAALKAIRGDAEKWAELLRMEREASRSRAA